MRRKISLKVNKGYEVDFNTAHVIPSGYINSLLPNNKWHGQSFKRSISSLQGGKLNPETGKLHFPHGAFFYVSSDDSQMMSEITIALFNHRRVNDGMEFDNIQFSDFKCHEDKRGKDGYDIVLSISPVLLTKKQENGLTRGYTLEDDGYLDMLLEQTKRKLRNRICFGCEGAATVTDNDIDNLKIEICGDTSKYKHKKVYINLHGKANMCSVMTLKITGKKEARELLYNIGLGVSTGYGFGAVTIIY